jgi:hypothetical protein
MHFRGSSTVGGSVINSILYGNEAPYFAYSNWYVGGATPVFTNCCSTPSLASYGEGNITADPVFANAAAYDYRLVRPSPCINTGLTMDWMTGRTDLAGNPRIVGGAVEMGAYEFLPPGTAIMVR